MSFARPSAVGTRADDLAALPLKALAERFASQAIATQAIATLGDLNVDLFDPRVNPNGGAIALGHPLGMSGARIALSAVEELHRNAGRYALVLLCIGVVQDLAVILEKI